MSEKIRQQLQAELSAAEEVVSRLRVEQEPIESKIKVIKNREPLDAWLLEQTRHQLEVVTRKIDCARAEALRPRVELLKLDLPGAESKVIPLQLAFDEAMSKYREARVVADEIGFRLGVARLNANSIRREISDHEKTIEEAAQSAIAAA